MSIWLDYGVVVGRLTLLNTVPNHQQYGAQWLCRCACGAEVVVVAAMLRRGVRKSCGCINRERAKAEKAAFYEQQATRPRAQTAEQAAAAARKSASTLRMRRAFEEAEREETPDERIERGRRGLREAEVYGHTFVRHWTGGDG